MSEHIGRIFDAIEDMLTPAKARSVNSHRYFAEHNGTFRRACELAGIPATRRQASKWHQRRGLAYGKRREAEAALQASGTHSGSQAGAR